MRLTGLTTIFAIALSAATTPEAKQRALLQQYCVGCHGESGASAGINLSSELSQVATVRDTDKPAKWIGEAYSV